MRSEDEIFLGKFGPIVFHRIEQPSHEQTDKMMTIEIDTREKLERVLHNINEQVEEAGGLSSEAGAPDIDAVVKSLNVIGQIINSISYLIHQKTKKLSSNIGQHINALLEE